MQNYLQSAILQMEEFQTRSETEVRQLKVEYSARRNSDLERLQKAHGEEIRRWQEAKNTETLELKRIYETTVNDVRAENAKLRQNAESFSSRLQASGDTVLQQQATIGEMQVNLSTLVHKVQELETDNNKLASRLDEPTLKSGRGLDQ